MIQLNIFTDKVCSHCGGAMAPDARNNFLADGFYDQDTDELVHWNCKAEHYRKKNLAGMQGLYSEMPLIL